MAHHDDLDALLATYVTNYRQANAWLERVEGAVEAGTVDWDEHLRASEAAIRARVALRRFLLDHGLRLPAGAVRDLDTDQLLVDEGNGAIGG